MISEITPKYDPTIQNLVAQAKSDWGSPELNRQNLIPYGIDLLDRALWGIDIIDGELIVIIGAHKQRKTTLWLNVCINIMTARHLTRKPRIVIDTLESGMPPRKYRDTIIANLASRHLFDMGHTPINYCQACDTSICNELKLSAKFLRYRTRSKAQNESIEYALDTMASDDWNLLIYGSHPDQGNVRNLKNAVEDKESRWIRLIEEEGVDIFAVDHLQQYNLRSGTDNEYEKQQRVISVMGSVVAMYNVAVVMLSQVSLKSIREAAAGAGELTASGGNKSAQEGNVVMVTKYDRDTPNKMGIKIGDAREAGSLSLIQDLNKTSGAFFGEARTADKVTFVNNPDTGGIDD